MHTLKRKTLTLEVFEVFHQILQQLTPMYILLLLGNPAKNQSSYKKGKKKFLKVQKITKTPYIHMKQKLLIF